MVVTVYGTADCRYCTRAKNLLEFYSIPYTYHDIQASDQAWSAWHALGRSTVPQVVIDGVHIGGSDELKVFLG